STMRTAVPGVNVAGLKTTVLPATNAGAIFQTGMATGKFQGVTHATTPSGCLIVYAKLAGNSDSIVSPFMRRDSPAHNTATLIDLCSSPRDSEMVLPSSCVRIRASSSLLSSIKRAAFATILPRAGAGVARQSRKASAAASTAARASARVACFTVPIVSLVFEGLRFSTTLDDADSIHFPP